MKNYFNSILKKVSFISHLDSKNQTGYVSTDKNLYSLDYCSESVGERELC